MKENELLENRFRDLAEKAYQTTSYTFTGFLNMMDLDLLFRLKNELGYVPFEVFGGCENCERQMAKFGSSELFGYQVDYPIMCLKVQPLLKKFSEEFTHRDFLGAIMNLGIERNLIGDIMVKEKEAYLFCKDSIAPFIIENLTKIKHTHVKTSLVEQFDQEVKIEFEEKEISTSSLRCDGVVAKLYQLSRSQSLELFAKQKIFVNGRCMENNSYLLKEADVISVRGFGKSVFVKSSGMTKKGKLILTLKIYK